MAPACTVPYPDLSGFNYVTSKDITSGCHDWEQTHVEVKNIAPNPNPNPNTRMSDEADLPCPICRAGSGGNQCPLQPQWSDSEAMAHLCSSGFDSDKQDFWEAAVMHYASEGHLVSNK